MTSGKPDADDRGGTGTAPGTLSGPGRLEALLGVAPRAGAGESGDGTGT
ncbi:hypothetical protein J7I94_20325 [Streptomyces sp. ISL-12]|nr:hypothetical protein [Streptomyces sp. ISL-12]MBT2412879.1 hypothetical protein [Streptomyces sp. ISL-12]